MGRGIAALTGDVRSRRTAALQIFRSGLAGDLVQCRGQPVDLREHLDRIRPISHGEIFTAFGELAQVLQRPFAQAQARCRRHVATCC